MVFSLAFPFNFVFLPLNCSLLFLCTDLITLSARSVPFAFLIVWYPEVPWKRKCRSWNKWSTDQYLCWIILCCWQLLDTARPLIYPSVGCPESLAVSTVLSGQCLRGFFSKAQLAAGFRFGDVLRSSCVNMNFTFSLKKEDYFLKIQKNLLLLNGNLHCSVLLSSFELGFVSFLTREKKINVRVKCAMNQTQ